MNIHAILKKVRKLGSEATGFNFYLFMNEIEVKLNNLFIFNLY